MPSFLRNCSTVLKIYGIPIALIIGWWLFAFKQPSISALSLRNPSDVHATNQITDIPHPHPSLFRVDRNKLKEALSGDYSLMGSLILEWDVDAKLMQANEIGPIKSLSEGEFLRAQSISRKLKNATSDNAQRAVNPANTIVDDAGNAIAVHRPFRRVLPQTYAAASFLLALTSPSDIIALPRRLRDHVQLYPKNLTELIPLDIDRYNAEKLFDAKPEIAFVSHYSHPATIQTLANQGMQLYMMKNLNNLIDINDELLNIGNIIGRTLEAELLVIFMKAAMAALDNKLTFAAKHFAEQHEDLPKILFLYHHQNYSVPTLKTLTGHLLERMRPWDMSLKFALSSERTAIWSMPINKEQILNLDPDCLIVAAQNNQKLEQDIRNDSALSQLSAVRNNRIYFVDEAVQQSSSQYIVLAYHDLVNIVAGLQ